MIKYWLPSNLPDLVRATDGSSGYDLRARIDVSVVLRPGDRAMVHTGLRTAIPVGVEGQIRSRSGLALRHGVIVLNAPGTIDADYRGDAGVTLINLGRVPYQIHDGERIAQIVFCPVIVPSAWWFVLGGGTQASYAAFLQLTTLSRVVEAAELGTTDRGEGGHGSTGTR